MKKMNIKTANRVIQLEWKRCANDVLTRFFVQKMNEMNKTKMTQKQQVLIVCVIIKFANNVL